MLIILWEYTVVEGREAEFEKVYGPHGEWAQLFKQDPGYLGTDLLRDLNRPRHYITMDRWTSSTAFESFQENYHVQYEALDARCASLTAYEARRGIGDLIFST